jgi:hypothetical protein
LKDCHYADPNHPAVSKLLKKLDDMENSIGTLQNIQSAQPLSKIIIKPEGSKNQPSTITQIQTMKIGFLQVENQSGALDGLLQPQTTKMIDGRHESVRKIKLAPPSSTKYNPTLPSEEQHQRARTTSKNFRTRRNQFELTR